MSNPSRLRLGYGWVVVRLGFWQLTGAKRNFSTLSETFLCYWPEENKICKDISTELQKVDDNWNNLIQNFSKLTENILWYALLLHFSLRLQKNFLQRENWQSLNATQIFLLSCRKLSAQNQLTENLYTRRKFSVECTFAKFYVMI